MKFLVVAVGNRMPAWVEAGFAEYTRRMPHEAAVELLEIKPEKRTAGKKTEQLLSAESVRIKAALRAGCRTVALDEHGRQWTTARLADAITGWMREGGDTAFIIGGADGLHADLKRAADETLALSALTLPHGLARVLLAEQLYRALSLIKRHPYHRE